MIECEQVTTREVASLYWFTHESIANSRFGYIVFVSQYVCCVELSLLHAVQTSHIPVSTPLYTRMYQYTIW